MMYICIFSNKLDLNQAIRVSHKIYGGKVHYPVKSWDISINLRK